MHGRETEVMKPSFLMLSHEEIPGGKGSYRFLIDWAEIIVFQSVKTKPKYLVMRYFDYDDRTGFYVFRRKQRLVRNWDTRVEGDDN